MYCPECGGEYRPGIETCPTCEVPLTEERDARFGPSSAFRAGTLGQPPRASMEDPDAPRGPRLAPPFVDLVGFIDESEARAARGRLKEAKIVCELVIRDAFGPGIDGEVAGDEYWIRVPGDAAAAAADLLGLEPVLREDACPSCGAPLEEDEDCLRCGHARES